MAYTGQTFKIPLGDYGLLTDMRPADVPLGGLIKAYNLSFETGMLEKAPGSAKYNSTPLATGVVGLFDWWPNSVQQYLIAACSSGSIYADIGDRTFSGGTAITTLTGVLDQNCQFVSGGQETASRSKKLFLFSANNQLKVLEGTTLSFASVDNPAADWTSTKYPTFGFIHRNRLWAFSGQRYYASDTADHENFTTNYLTGNIFPGEGDDLIGGQVFKGRAFVFKKGGFVYYLNDEDADSDNWYWDRLSSNFGLASPHAIFEIANDLLAINESGSPTSYSATQKFGDIESADVFRLLQIEDYLRHTISFSGISLLHTLYYESKKQGFITYRTTQRTTNDMILLLDFNRDRVRPSIWSKDSAECLALRKDIYGIARPMYGDSSGYVYLMDQEDRLVGATAYTGRAKTGHTDLGRPDKNKIFDFLAVEFMPQGTWDLSVDVYIDGNLSETITFPMDVRDDGLDTFTLDTDPLGTEETQTILKPLHGSGRRISFDCYQAGSNQNFRLASLTVGFRVGGEQATRV